MGQAKSKQMRAALQRSTAEGVAFPNDFSLFYEPSWSKLTLRLGPDKHSPIYAFSLPQGWYGELFLFNGPDIDAASTSSAVAPIASAANGGRFKAHSTIYLAPLKPNTAPVQEELRMRLKGPMGAYSFAIPVPGESLPQRYEWISSGSADVKALGEYRHGWKLVRADHVSGDDSDVLAVWADASMSMSKAARFRFVNKGATGEMGELWRFMTVVTFARVWQLNMAAAQTAGSAA